MLQSRKHYFIVGNICLLGLIGLSILFFKERAAFCDSAFQVVYMIIEKRPAICWVRPGAILPEFIPLIAIWLHAGLKTVMICESASYLIFYFLIYLLAYRFSKKKLLFFIIPLYLVLMTNDVFYWPRCELQQGMIWLCLYTVLLFEKRIVLSPRLSATAHFFIILWIQFFHPLMLFPILFLIVYYYASESRLFGFESINHIMLCAVSFAIRYLVGMSFWYERDRLGIGDAIRNKLPRLFSLNLVHHFFHTYTIYLLLFIVAVTWLIFSGKYIRAVMLLSFSIGYWVLIMICAPENVYFYNENMLLPLSFMIALPIMADIISDRSPRYMAVLFLIIMIIRLNYMYSAHGIYSAHYDSYKPYIEYAQKNKLTGVFVDDKLIDEQKAIVTWPSGYETMLITAMASPDSCVQVQVDPDPDRYEVYLDSAYLLVSHFRIWQKSRIPSNYFKFQPGKYKIIKTSL